MIPIRLRIQEGLNKANMKQADLVRETGISKGTISGYLSGRYTPKQKNIYKIAQALNVEIGWLMGFDEHQRIQERTYYYEKCKYILNDLSDSDIKKAYRVLALEFNRLDELKDDLK